MAIFTGTTGNDTYAGTSGDDTITGDEGNDTLFGAGGSDLIYGDLPASGEGMDELYGEAGEDTIYAGGWDDTVDGGAGSDLLDGGDQDFFDTLTYASAGNALALDVLSGQATVGLDTDTFSNFEAFVGTGFGDVISASGLTTGVRLDGAGGADSLTGGDGHDHLIGGFSADTLAGGLGDDTLDGGYGDDLIQGGEGTDTAVYTGFGGGITVNLLLSTAQYTGGAGTDTLSGIENLTGGAYNDRFTGSTGDNFMQMGAGSDTVVGLGGRDTIYGNAGNDNLNGGAGNDTLTGNEGRDVLLGGADDDFLLGGDENDQLRGGTGADVLVGGDGRDILIGGDYVGGGFPGDGEVDVFDFNYVAESAPGGATRDTIRDFEVGIDLFDVSTIDADDGLTPEDTGFDFIGTAQFSGTAGELRYFTTAASTVVRADVDGDGIADFEVLMNGVMTLSESDFVL